MSRSRLAIFLLLGCLVAFVASEYSPRDVVVGARKPDDGLLRREFVLVPSRLFRRAKHRFSYEGGDAAIVSQVRLLDQNKKGNGATATVSKGGPEFNYVVVDFASARGHSIDFIVEVYGTSDEDISGEWLRNEMDRRAA